MSGSFRWQDGERIILFGRGMLGEVPGLLGEGYTLLSTERALAAARELAGGAELAGAAARVELVPAGQVDELAAELRAAHRELFGGDGEAVVGGGELLVALGGGRVIDVAKALAAAAPPSRVAAIPTTLSGAEMTSIHRHATGVEASAARVRPAYAVNDPRLSASQPPAELARSAANALGHVADGLVTPLSNPVATMAALRAARLIAEGLKLGGPGCGDVAASERERLALGALLAGYVIGSSGFGLHHVLAQTLARFAPVSHGAANAAMLPHSLRALQARFPGAIASLAEPLGGDPPLVAARLAALGEASHLSELGVSETQLERCLEEAAARPELHMTPPAPDAAELRALYRAAF